MNENQNRFSEELYRLKNNIIIDKTKKYEATSAGDSTIHTNFSLINFAVSPSARSGLL